MSCFHPGGHSHMLVDIKCLSIDPLFLCWPYTQWPPFFIQSTPNDPFFPLLYQILHKNCKFLRVRAHFEKCNNFVAILTENLQILSWNCTFAHWMTPISGSPHQKSPHFFWCPHRMTPFFWRNLTPNAPYFLSPIGPCTSLPYLSAPPGAFTYFLDHQGPTMEYCIHLSTDIMKETELTLTSATIFHVSRNSIMCCCTVYLIVCMTTWYKIMIN